MFLQDFLTTATYREVQSLFCDIYLSFQGAHSTIQITTPRELDLQTKKAIRSHYNK